MNGRVLTIRVSSAQVQELQDEACRRRKGVNALIVEKLFPRAAALRQLENHSPVLERTATEARRELFQLLDRVQSKGSHVIIFHKGRPSVVMVPMSDYHRWRPIMEQQGIDSERTQVVVTHRGEQAAALISHRTYQTLTIP